MISKNTLDLLKKDIVKILIIQILNNLILSQLTGEQIFNNKWKNNLVGTLIGFLVYNLVTKKYTQAFKDLIQSTNPNVNNALSDILKFGTILVVKHIYVLGRIQFSPSWLFKTLIILFTYLIFHIFVKDKIPKIKNYQKSSNIIFRNISIILASDYLTDYDIEGDTLNIIISNITSVFIYGHFISKHIDKLI